MQNFYTVRPGDTISSIARRWELPVETLIAANNLTQPYTIFVGQQLSVPPGVNVYRVQTGDTVYRISQAFGVPTSVIINANGLRPPYVITVGQLITVPPGVPYYVVQSGDTLYNIASRFNVVTSGRINFEEIRRVNQLSNDTIYPGMRLVIPYAPPGDNGVIAYFSNVSGKYDLWLYHPRNGGNQQITSGLGEAYSIPFWSPDASKIAFVGRNGILYVVTLGTNTIASVDQFTEGLGVYLDWSPNSRQLVYSKTNGIVLYNTQTHQAQILQQPNTTDVQWFPDGQDLLFQASDSAGASQLFRIKIDGSARTQITQNTGGRLNNVRLSPNGLSVLYTTPGASISIIFTVDLSSGAIFEVRGGPLAKNFFPTWSPNSATIAYSATAFEDKGYFSLIRTTGRQGENDRTRAISDCFATPVTWSPDGRKIAYLSGCKRQGTASQIWMVDLNHPVPIRLVEGGTITALAWSPAPLKNTYTSSTYHVQFQYPSHWVKVNSERYEGHDGFFQISAISSVDPINAVCHNEAFHPLLPYGSHPRIVNTVIQKQEACFIYPSANQPVDMKGQSALIVRYPTPITIDGTTYHFFILWSDQKHIVEISQSITFIL